jgi:hypothetical protein
MVGRRITNGVFLAGAWQLITFGPYHGELRVEEPTTAVQSALV